MKIGVIGLGLIGGSFALSAKKNLSDCSLYGMDNNPEHLRQAFKLGIINQSLTPLNYSLMDVIILAIPVNAVFCTNEWSSALFKSPARIPSI